MRGRKDRECLNRRALAFLHMASIRLMLRRLRRDKKRSQVEASATWCRQSYVPKLNDVKDEAAASKLAA